MKLHVRVFRFIVFCARSFATSKNRAEWLHFYYYNICGYVRIILYTSFYIQGDSPRHTHHPFYSPSIIYSSYSKSDFWIIFKNTRGFSVLLMMCPVKLFLMLIILNWVFFLKILTCQNKKSKEYRFRVIIYTYNWY